MKVIFLDMDGVMNCDAFLASRFAIVHPQHHDEREECTAVTLAGELGWFGHMVQPSKVRLLDDIVRRTGAKVVISSSWRYSAATDELASILAAFGFSGDVIGETSKQEVLERRERVILRWVTEHPEVSAYVALDDNLGETLDDAWEQISGHVVSTDFAEGLTVAQANRAVAILQQRAP